jgi:hypothetical protein
LELDEENGSPVVLGELLRWNTSPGSGRPRDILNFQRGEGFLYDDVHDRYTNERLKYASDGTLKLLAYLTVLYDPEPPPIVGIEEPENFLHPRLLPVLAEEARLTAGRSQLLVTTHSPHFVDALRRNEQRSARPIPGFPHRLGRRRSIAILMRFLVALVKHWSGCCRSMVTTKVAWRRLWQPPRSRNT